MTTSSATLVASDKGCFSFSGVTYGKRALMVYLPDASSPTQTLGPIPFTLDKDDLEILKNIHKHNQLEYNDRFRPLLQLLAILEYRNGENWCDVHPVLRRLINE